MRVIRFFMVANAILLVPASFILFSATGPVWKLAGLALILAAATLATSAWSLGAREKRSLIYYRASVAILVAFGVGVSVAMLSKASDPESWLFLFVFLSLVAGGFWVVDIYIREFLTGE